jgi:hypothetical protein
MKLIKYGIVMMSIFGIATSCKKNEAEKVLDDIPKLNILSQSTNSIKYMDTTSFISFVFTFEDGGRNIATRPEDQDSSIILLIYDFATDTFRTKYNLPMPQVNGNDFQKNGGIQATLTLDLPSYYFTPQGGAVNPSGNDTISLGIALQDYDGNSSDTIIRGPIFVSR